jgi:hypothetical protein
MHRAFLQLWHLTRKSLPFFLSIRILAVARGDSCAARLMFLDFECSRPQAITQLQQEVHLSLSSFTLRKLSFPPGHTSILDGTTGRMMQHPVLTKNINTLL